MDFNYLNSFIAPVLVIIAGIVLKVSKGKRNFGIFSKFWYFFVLSRASCAKNIYFVRVYFGL